MRRDTPRKYQSSQIIKLSFPRESYSLGNKKVLVLEEDIVNSRKQLQLPKIYPSQHNYRIKQPIKNLNEKQLILQGAKFMGNKLKQHELHNMTLQVPTNKRAKQSYSYDDTGLSVYKNMMSNSSNILGIQLHKRSSFKVYVQEGNNSRVIKELFRKRPHVKIVYNKNQANIIWTCMYDHFLSKQTTKYVLITPKSSPTEEQHLTPTDLMMRMCDKKDQESLFSGNSSNLKLDLYIMQINILKLHNHLVNHHEISDKKCLLQNISLYCTNKNINRNDIIPESYHMINTQKINQIAYDKHLWLIKPGQDSNRGTGITIARQKQQIAEAVDKLLKNGKTAIIQKYIQPMLYKGRKFDVRCFVLVACVQNKITSYFYKEGYLRTCSKEYNDDPNNIFRHLTNDAIQKQSKDYGKFQQCNKLSFLDLETLLSLQGLSYRQTIKRMKKLAIYSIKAAQKELRKQNNIFAYEIFGYDYLIDKNGKVWLIEINTNPCFQFQGSLLSRVIWHMLQNSFKLVLDPLIIDTVDLSSCVLRDRLTDLATDNRYQIII